MPSRHPLALALMIATGLAAASAPAGSAAPAQPTVVELFTSQGCSSCPPANANHAALAERLDLLTLSFGVTYWDQLGWKDTFAHPAYTNRQRAYARALGRDAPFTPQIVVDGRVDGVGSRKGEIEGLLRKAGRRFGPAVTLDRSQVLIGPGAASGGAADVWLVRYDPRTVQVPVRRGENGGKTLPHRNVVKALERLGAWSGEPVRFAVATAPVGLRTAVLVQARDGGRILAAAKG